MYVVAYHLPRGSKLRWHEDMGGGLTSVRKPRVVQIIHLLKENSSTFEDGAKVVPRVQLTYSP